MSFIDLSALSENLTSDKKEYEKIFGLRMASGFDAKQDFVVLGINEKIELVRDELANLTQPGRTGKTDFTTSAITQKSRIAGLKPVKVDLSLSEQELYQLRVSYLGRKEAADPKDIHSLAGRTYIMSRIFSRIGKEVNRAIVKGVEDREAGTVGGINLFDGLQFKFTEGYTTVANGGKGDIPASNKVTGAATTVTKANILAELEKLVDVIVSSEDLVEYQDENAAIYVSPIWYQMMVSALESQVSNGSQVITKKGDKLFVNALPNTEIKPRTYMIGVNNMFWTLEGNLFYLHQDVDTDVPRIKFQEVGRDLNILIDFELNVDYADGRVIVLYK